jgi:peptidoglycan/xylan/chitin deacetylase (PgdA/CDA1 family)
MKFVVCYHSIDETRKTSTSPKLYERQLILLKFLNDKYRSVTKSNLIEIHFDDGYDNNFAPIIRAAKSGFEVKFFISTDYIDSNELFFWDAIDWVPLEILSNLGVETLRDCQNKQEVVQKISELETQERREITSLLTKTALNLAPNLLDYLKPITGERIQELNKIKNVAINSHTLSHGSLGRMSNKGVQFTNEIHESISKLKALGIPENRSFAYPFGTPKDLLAEDNLDLMKKYFDYAYTTECRAGTNKDPSLLIPRVVVQNYSNAMLLSVLIRSLLKNLRIAK